MTKSAGWVTYAIVLIVGSASAYLLGWLHPRPEGELRLTAGVLELMGIVCVALGISDVRRQFKLKPLGDEVRAELTKFVADMIARVRRLLGLRQDAIAPVIGAVAHATLTLSARGRGKVRPGPQASLEERMQSLEQIVDGMVDAVWRIEDDLLRETTEREKVLATERALREAADTQLEQAIHQYAVGGIRLEIVGLFWLVLGVLLATLAPELSPHL